MFHPLVNSMSAMQKQANERIALLEYDAMRVADEIRLPNSGIPFEQKDYYEELMDDMENYMQYQLMGRKVKNLRLKTGVIPHRFMCQNTKR
ncbi:hypothetical protein NQ317_000756 [Molorchus minor]|uniref:Uncharacterized protein n=1 Tax=Molorchus minor TaxID=1323400 RepID=A0ABQ9IRE7_9CUCU|nr:hypothetical protein NQ317_000756 [Molorchus minor]